MKKKKNKKKEQVHNKKQKQQKESTKGEKIKKRKAIFKHKSQKDGAVFPGDDPREFWQRAEERNAKTAITYSELGLAKYAAIEGFKR